MSIPPSCSVLVVGGGPGGSYTAAALAREGIDVVLLEAEVFPRYHIGESMLPSIRHFLRFIDLESMVDNYGFEKKFGAAFKLNEKRDAYTDFVAAGGPNAYSWNFIRSESDELIFRHAGKCGAKIFDGVRVNSIEFTPWDTPDFPVDPKLANPGRPVSAAWSRKSDGSSGIVKFEYLVDASGRAGIMSTKYLKNRKFNEGLRNIAHWSYWKGAGRYAPGTHKENQPFFEALTDASGWCWTIPLHNGTMSVGIVMRQDLLFARKKALGSPSGDELYKDCMKLAPHVRGLLENAEQVADVKSASDWSYNAPAYAGPFYRVVGDAGCFIDPYFSSGVHLALASALSAAVTIQAVRKKQCTEFTGARWHSNKVTEGYTRFLLVVITALKQIREQTEPVLSDFDEDGFDTAFGFFRPIIQGTADADVRGRLTQSEVSKTVDFCLNAFLPVSPEKREQVLQKIKDNKGAFDNLSEEELTVLDNIRARKMLRSEDPLDLNHFQRDVFDGLMPHLMQGQLGLIHVMKTSHDEKNEKELAELFNAEAVRNLSSREAVA